MPRADRNPVAWGGMGPECGREGVVHRRMTRHGSGSARM